MKAVLLSWRRCILATFLFIFAIAVLRLGVPTWRYPPSETPSNIHPIEQLHAKALDEHNSLVARQSVEFSAAVEAYRTRYGESPPPGYGVWFKRARQLNSPIIDDFDSIRSDIAPFRQYMQTNRDLDLTADDKDLLFKERLLQACIGGYNITFAGYQEQWFVDGVRALFDEVSRQIPRTCVLINLLDEPRTSLQADAPEATTPLHKALRFENINDHRTLWPEVSKLCPQVEKPETSKISSVFHNLRNRLHLKSSPSTATSNVATDWLSTTDLCAAKAQTHYSFLDSPAQAKLTRARIPLLSPSKLSTFSDILLPSIWRFAEQPEQEDHPSDDSVGDIPPPVPEDTSWSSKSPIVYWRGSTTGGYATLKNWRTLHRQSLILAMTSALPVGNLDAAFTDTIQCGPAACEAQRKELPMAEWEPRKDGSRFKILLDVDGNGLSGRFYDLLRSDSAVLRYSLQREWHDERLVPWLHYIPLRGRAGGIGEEVKEIVEFLFNTPRGDHILQRIAEESKSWAERSLRNEDMMLYAWRLMLEMARNRWEDESSKGRPG
ncbi:MAG: F-actin-capping protein subunit beta [Chrysothrix sp. TS-e1954]|nr:MAG: F-actin-capping protein subunit beta [Chrysothrix sp. TS-e1954]